jgi:hypothetical protein
MHRVHELSDRKDRHAVEVDAVVYRTDGTKASVKLRNLSDGGCLIDSANDYRVGERLQIALPRMGYIRAQVRWALPGSAGAKFLVESDF